MTTAEAREVLTSEARRKAGGFVPFSTQTLDALIATVRAEEREKIVKALRTFANTGDDPRVMLERHLAADFVERLK